ncbi:CHRD domain-containing protein [Catalinimonas sp. 4WD22]|uniref:CHRD domain-containing protein n=1 Tax=Catalinimonas locisalis TaxID=3133978 RepID=UPI0031010A81
MKNLMLLGFCLTLLFVLSCQEEESFDKMLAAQVEIQAHEPGPGEGQCLDHPHKMQNHIFKTHLNGQQVAPQPVDTKAQGQANFKLSDDCNKLYFKLIVANIENITEAHVHLIPGPAHGVGHESGGGHEEEDGHDAGHSTGDVVLWLYPAAAPAQLIPGRTNGVLAEGVLTESDLVGELADERLQRLIRAMHQGRLYVDVHTHQHPAGEIRGSFLSQSSNEEGENTGSSNFNLQ